MLYLEMLFITVVTMLIVTVVGLPVCELLPVSLRGVGRAYFSPVLGLAVFILLASAYGWIAPFDPARCGVVTLLLVGYALWRERRWRPVATFLAMIAGFTVVASAAPLFPVLRFGAFSPYNDAFTYLVHAQWLQRHAFSTMAVASGYYPAATQVLVYQTGGHRMGASFFLAWVQALFHLDWSYYAYPAAVAVPLTAGALAVGGTVKLITMRGHLVPILTAAATATTLNGFVFGSTFGFFAQTFGMALAVAAAALVAASMELAVDRAAQDTTRDRGPIRQALEMIPASLVVSALAYSYELLPFFVVALAGLTVTMRVLHPGRLKPMLALLGIVSLETILILNMGLVRMLRNVITTTVRIHSAGGVQFGWTVPWHPWEFVAMTFGLRSSIEGFWLLAFRRPTAIAFLVLIPVIGYAVLVRLRRSPIPAVLLMTLACLGAFTAGFLYFRYWLQGFVPGEVGQTFAQFKLAKWATVFAFVLVGVSADSYGRRHWLLTHTVTACLAAAICLGLAGNYRAAFPVTDSFNTETGYERNGFDAFLKVRGLTADIPANDVIYMNLGGAHLRLRQMVSYILWDHKLAGDYNDDVYIFYHLPLSDRAMPFSEAKWVIEFSPGGADSPPGAAAGNLVIRRPVVPILRTVTGGYDREDAGRGWRVWTPKQLEMQYNVPAAMRAMSVKFTYMPAVADRTLTVIVSGRQESVFTLPMKPGWNDYVSSPVPVDDAHLTVRFVGDGAPVRIGVHDSRLALFLIQNVELIEGPGAVDAMSGRASTEPILQKVTGGYDRENDGRTWRYWASKELEMQYVVPPAMTAMRMKFTYLPAGANRTLTVVVRGRKESVFTLSMKPGWHDYVSPPLSVDDPNLTVRFSVSGEPIRLGPSDPRVGSFLIQNLELVNLPPDASQVK